MEKKKCAKCGKEFKAFKPEFTLCPDCKQGKTIPEKGGGSMPNYQRDGYKGSGGGSHGGERHSNYNERGGGRQEISLNDNYLLQTFYDGDQMKSEVYRDIPEKIADIFDSAGMKSTSIRRFYNVVRQAYDRYRFDPIHNFLPSKELIESLDHLVTYSQSRDVTKPCFTKFIKHYIDLAVKDANNLRAFKKHFESVIGFMPKK